MKKTIVLGVCGGIAAFKAAQLTSDLIKAGYDVEVIMTKNATQFVAPLTFEALISHNVVVDTFEKVQNRSIHHISLAKKADLFILVPASANVIAKVAHGIADDMLTTTFLACSRQKVICPAMNTQMYENPITQRNLQLCREYGYDILEPASGHLACGDSGKGKLCDLSVIMNYVERFFHRGDQLKGRRVLRKRSIRCVTSPTTHPERWAMRSRRQRWTWGQRSRSSAVRCSCSRPHRRR